MSDADAPLTSKEWVTVVGAAIVLFVGGLWSVDSRNSHRVRKGLDPMDIGVMAAAIGVIVVAMLVFILVLDVRRRRRRPNR